MDRFDAMQAFVRVVETGSFTKAAETLHMSKTSVSQLIQQLEARLRVKLLNRTTRKSMSPPMVRRSTSVRFGSWPISTMRKPVCPALRLRHEGACAWTCPARLRGPC